MRVRSFRSQVACSWRVTDVAAGVCLLLAAACAVLAWPL